MNYRHHFHAGNFADVVKHVLLVQLVRALQKKETGFVYVDTHAGRGSYDLSTAAKGDSRIRNPEWPDGIGRLWAAPELPELVQDYVTLVKQFDHDRGNRDALPRFYPGSPWLARLLARPQDRLALCEKHPEEFTVLSEEFRFSPRTTIEEMDGYVAMRAVLPPLERRALTLIDPAYEVQDEFEQAIQALRDGLARLRTGVFAVWYPLTSRARVDVFFEQLLLLSPPSTVVLELAIAGETSAIKMRGCGLAVINPPWKFDDLAVSALTAVAPILQQGRGGTASKRWLVARK